MNSPPWHDLPYAVTNAMPYLRIMMSIVLLGVLTLALSAFFSGMEIAFISASRIEVELTRQSGGRRGRLLSRLFQKPDRFISIMLVGNNIALVLFAILTNQLLDQWLSIFPMSAPMRLLVNTVLTTLIVLLFGEFIPKTISGIYANRLLHFFTYPLYFFRWLLAIPAGIMNSVSSLFLRYVMQVPTDERIEVFTRLDLQDFVDGRAGTHDDSLETDMFRNALHLRQTRVRECMVPRPEIVAIDINSSVEDFIDTFKSSKLSRIPVVDGDIEEVKGYVHHLQFIEPPEDILSLLYDMAFVPEAMNVQDLLVKFMQSGTNIAMVVDEYGSISGIITLEDVLEEIFGEIEDEHDVEDIIDQQISPTEFLFSGRIEIDHINEKYPQIDIPEGEYTTLSGYLVITTERIPEQGSQITLGDYTFILTQVSDKKIEKIRVLVQQLED